MKTAVPEKRFVNARSDYIIHDYYRATSRFHLFLCFVSFVNLFSLADDLSLSFAIVYLLQVFCKISLLAKVFIKHREIWVFCKTVGFIRNLRHVFNIHMRTETWSEIASREDNTSLRSNRDRWEHSLHLYCLLAC